jgi:hypothetical protein
MRLYKAGRLSFEAGWFSGEPFRLFRLSLIDIIVPEEFMTIIGVQIIWLFIDVNYRLHD